MGHFDAEANAWQSKPQSSPKRPGWRRFVVGAALTTLLLLSNGNQLESTRETVSAVADWAHWKLKPLPADPAARARALLARYPLVDGHIDLPILSRAFFRNQLDEIDLYKPLKGQVDIPRLREGGVGGFFWSAYIMCPEDAGYPSDNNGNFTTATWRVRDTLEQIDISRLLIEKHKDTFELVDTAKGWRKAMKKGKIAAMIGIEGGHQIGSSLATLRAYYALGARYLTLTHTCHNALGDSCGYQGLDLEPRWGGLSPFGRIATKEMNRLGMILDLSHTDPSTASDALTLSLAPPIFSHSNARGVHDVKRNVPDSILRRIGATSKYGQTPYSLADDGEGGLGWGNDTGEAEKVIPGGDSLVMLNFSPGFVSEWDDGTPGGVRANVSLVADHADYIGRLAGRDHVGIGSDFDGIAHVPEGLEDTAHYPALIAELIARGWTDKEIAGVTSENLLRVLEKVEKVAAKLRHATPETAIFEGRDDMKRRDHF